MTAGDDCGLRVPRHLVLDMDGTIYLGSRLFEGTPRLFATARRHGIGISLVTNNSSRSKADYVRHLAKLGLTIAPEQLYTSGDSAIDYLHAHGLANARVLLLGTGSLGEQFSAAGIELVDDDPDVVVVGFDTSLTYPRLCRAGYWIAHGKPFIATHPDVYCPTEEATLLVDCGAITAALERATGRRATVLGKPNPAMLEGILMQHGLAPGEVAVIGDRLHTDLAMAHAAGCVAVLVLTGETSREDLAGAALKPDQVCEDIGAFEDWLTTRLG